MERSVKQFVDLVSVSKEYGASGSEVKALDGVSLSVERGEIAVVLGASGAGKTTLLNLIAGLEKPTRGQIRVLGMDLASASEGFLSEFRSTNIGFIFQSYNLLSTLTAQENVELMMELSGSH